jgi:RNA polymerase sigma-70 factor (ECF subfamily)
MADFVDAWEPTRQSLLVRLRDCGDSASWQDFFDTYWRLIFAVARKSGLTEAEAQDAVQETVIAVARNIGTFRYDPARCSFKAWLLLIARQRIIWQLRRRLPRTVGGTPPEDGRRTSTLDRVPDPDGLVLDDLWEEEWRQNLTQAALRRVKRRVSPRQFQIFDLYVLQNWPALAVARTLHVSLAQVYLARHRVGRWLRKEREQLEKTAEVSGLVEPA